MKHAFYFVVLVTLCAPLGCGGGRKPIKTDYVEGTITYKGAPVTGASLAFSPVKEGEGHPAYGATDSSGNYKIQTFLGAPDKGTTPGEYIVTISKSVGVPTGRFNVDDDGNRLEIVDTKSVFSEVYNDMTRTPLRATVTKGGPNKFDFDLVDKP